MCDFTYFFDIFAAFNIIKSTIVKDIMVETDRGHYCPKNAYVDSPQGIGNGVTISAPHMVRIRTFFVGDRNRSNHR